MRLRIVIVAALSLAVASPWTADARIMLKESGSTLLFPVMNAWVAAYGQVQPEVDITTESSGSGAGVAAAMDGTAQIGASDAYLSDAFESRGDLVQIPLAISGQFAAYDVPGVADLRLSAGVLAAIYTGRLTRWNDARIAALNRGMSLPDATIVPLRRSDRSGDTFLFTSFLAAAAPHDWSIVPATSIEWPDVPGEESAKGNRELLDLVRNTKYAIAYIGISLYAQAHNAGVGIASLRNREGNFVAPSIAGLAAAAAHTGRISENGRVSLIDLPGAQTYPIANVEYAVVKKKQPDPATGRALRAFLEWIIEPSGGNAHALLDPVHFLALTDALRALSRRTIAALS